MTYALLSDDLLQRLEAAGVSREARLLYIEGMVHCATVQSDGVIRIRLTRISDADDPQALAEELIAAGLWRKSGSEYVILNYLRSDGGHQRSAAEKLKADEAHAKRQAAYEERGRRHAAGDHRICTGKCPNAGRDLRPPDASGDASPDVLVPVLSCPSDNEGQDNRTTIEGSADRGLTAATATPSLKEPHIYAERYTGKCGWCGKAPGNEFHQKASDYLQRASETLRSLGALGFSITHRYDESTNLAAHLPGYGLSLQYDIDADAITWAQLSIPGAAIDFDAQLIDQALDRIMAAEIPDATPPSEYEPMDTEHLDNVRANIDLVIPNEVSGTRTWDDVMPHMATFVALAPQFLAVTHQQEVAA